MTKLQHFSLLYRPTVSCALHNDYWSHSTGPIPMSVQPQAPILLVPLSQTLPLL